MEVSSLCWLKIQFKAFQELFATHVNGEKKKKSLVKVDIFCSVAWKTSPLRSAWWCAKYAGDVADEERKVCQITRCFWWESVMCVWLQEKGDKWKGWWVPHCCKKVLFFPQLGWKKKKTTTTKRSHYQTPQRELKIQLQCKQWITTETPRTVTPGDFHTKVTAGAPKGHQKRPAEFLLDPSAGVRRLPPPCWACSYCVTPLWCWLGHVTLRADRRFSKTPFNEEKDLGGLIMKRSFHKTKKKKKLRVPRVLKSLLHCTSVLKWHYICPQEGPQWNQFKG